MQNATLMWCAPWKYNVREREKKRKYMRCIYPRIYSLAMYLILKSRLTVNRHTCHNDNITDCMETRERISVLNGFNVMKEWQRCARRAHTIVWRVHSNHVTVFWGIFNHSVILIKLTMRPNWLMSFIEKNERPRKIFLFTFQFHLHIYILRSEYL